MITIQPRCIGATSEPQSKAPYQMIGDDIGVLTISQGKVALSLKFRLNENRIFVGSEGFILLSSKGIDSESSIVRETAFQLRRIATERSTASIETELNWLRTALNESNLQ